MNIRSIAMVTLQDAQNTLLLVVSFTLHKNKENMWKYLCTFNISINL